MAEKKTIDGEIAKRVVSARENLSQATAAIRLGVHKTTLSNYERGLRLPDAEFLQALYREFGVSPTWVLTGQEPRYVRPGITVAMLMTDAIARSQGFSLEQQRSLGVDDDTFAAYLSGTQVPEPALLKDFAALVGYPPDRLLAARELVDAIASVQTVDAQFKAHQAGREQATGLTDYELALIDQYRAADEKGKYLIESACEAVTRPTLTAWMRLGQAMSDASNSIEKKQ